MGQLTLSMLGGFEARIGLGPPLPVPTKKAQALLAYLALTPGQSHPRDKLAALLWADTAPGPARNALRQALFVLRRALGGIEGEILRGTGDAIALVPGAVESDTAAFERAVSEGTPASLDHAAELYRGDLLSGLGVAEPAFEDWLMTERERLRELALEALARLLAHQRTSGATARALQTALRLLALDPLQEPVHRTLMRLYGQFGRRDAALRQYQECVEILQRELGVEPEPETKALYQEILRQRPGQTVAVPLSGAAGPADRPLVGRGAEVVRLHEALAGAWAGHGQIAAVVGEAGIGKSRLLADLTAEAERRGGSVLLGRAYESEQILPFGPWVDALRQSAVLMSAPSLEGLEGVWLAELARLFPELVTAGLPAVAEPGDPLRLFEALARLLRHLALRQPLVLMLEDVHWADDMSLRFLAFLGRRLYEAPVLVAVSVREEEMADSPILHRTLDELASDGRLTRLALTRLGRDDTLALVRLLGRASQAAAGAQLAEQVWEASAGNPFIVVETMRAVGEGEALGIPAGLPLPTRVRDMIARRLDRLSPRGRQLASVAAVIGREFEFALLHRTAGLADHDAGEGLEELVRRRVLHATGERFDFTHDRIREVAYLALLPPHRRALHAAIVAAVEQLFGDRLTEHVEMVAYHAERGEVWDKAARYLRQAGVKAATRLAYRDALDYFERALAALERLPDGRERTVLAIDVHLDMGPVLMVVKGVAANEVEEAYLRARELCERANETRRLFPALWGLWYVEHMRGNPDRAHQMGERLLEVARENDDRDQLLEAHHSLWPILVERGEFARARTHIEHGYALYDPTRHRDLTLLYGDHDPGVCCRTIDACRLWLTGFPDQGLAAIEDAVRLARQGAHPHTMGRAIWYAAVLHFWRGETDAARARAAEVVALSDQLGIFTFFTVGARLLAYLVAGAGPGLAELGAELARLQTGGVLTRRVFLALLVAEAYERAGEPNRGLGVLADTVKAIEAGAERLYEPSLHRLRGELLLAAGRGAEDAEACFRRAVASAQAIGARSLELRAATSLARRLADRSARVEARAALAPVLGAFTEGHDTRDLRTASALLAELG